jgi:hypothetical protein
VGAPFAEYICRAFDFSKAIEAGADRSGLDFGLAQGGSEFRAQRIKAGTKFGELAVDISLSGLERGVIEARTLPASDVATAFGRRHVASPRF